MFGAVVVLLQGQATPGLHDQPLGLESIAAIDPLIGAPRAKHFRGAHRGFVASLAKELDRRLHILRPAKVGNENGICGDDHGQSLETNRDNQPFLLGAKKALRAVERDNRSSDDISVFVLLRDFPKRRPRPDIRPSDIHRQDEGVRRLLHDGNVDRDADERSKSLLARTHKQTVALKTAAEPRRPHWRPAARVARVRRG